MSENKYKYEVTHSLTFLRVFIGNRRAVKTTMQLRRYLQRHIYQLFTNRCFQSLQLVFPCSMEDSQCNVTNVSVNLVHRTCFISRKGFYQSCMSPRFQLQSNSCITVHFIFSIFAPGNNFDDGIPSFSVQSYILLLKLPSFRCHSLPRQKKYTTDIVN